MKNRQKKSNENTNKHERFRISQTKRKENTLHKKKERKKKRISMKIK